MSDFNTYVFELHHLSSVEPLRKEVVRTRKGPDQALKELPALSDGYRWDLDSLSGPYAESLSESKPSFKFSSRIKPYR